MKPTFVSLLVCLPIVFLSLRPGNAQPAAGDAPLAKLRDALKDDHAMGADHWHYNDLTAAIAEARRVNRPLFVTFRCVPCKACSGFDAEVAKGSDLIRTLAQTHFVPLRQVEMKGVDLSLFQFDYDLNWAAMFLNADGTVYGRYGTQSAEGPDAYNSIASLQKAMLRVVALHKEYPRNAALFAGKRGPDKPYKTALEMPGLENKEKLRGPTTRNNCIHCHMIHDAEHEAAHQNGTLTRERLWRYPLPENVGLKIDGDDGCRVTAVLPDSPASRAGVQAGDSITRMNGQAIVSIADMQWVLHHLPTTAATVEITADREGKNLRHALKLAPGWKETDFSWRGSRWSLKPRPGFWAPDANAAALKSLNLPPGSRAYHIRWINTGQNEGRAARQAGLREGDFIVAVNDQPVTKTPEQFQMEVRLNRKVGDKLPLTIVRNGERHRIELPLVD